MIQTHSLQGAVNRRVPPTTAQEPPSPQLQPHPMVAMGSSRREGATWLMAYLSNMETLGNYRAVCGSGHRSWVLSRNVLLCCFCLVQWHLPGWRVWGRASSTSWNRGVCRQRWGETRVCHTYRQFLLAESPRAEEPLAASSPQILVRASRAGPTALFVCTSEASTV